MDLLPILATDDVRDEGLMAVDRGTFGSWPHGPRLVAMVVLGGQADNGAFGPVRSGVKTV